MVIPVKNRASENKNCRKEFLAPEKRNEVAEG
jgi:hypothetical protein